MILSRGVVQPNSTNKMHIIIFVLTVFTVPGAAADDAASSAFNVFTDLAP
jgi:hypothetical protein